MRLDHEFYLREARKSLDYAIRDLQVSFEEDRHVNENYY